VETSYIVFFLGDGTLGPFYLEISVKKHTLTNIGSDYGYLTYLSKKENRRGETGYLQFLETCIEDGYLNRGDLLLTDNERSFKTKAVKRLLKRNGISLIFFPAYMNHLMSPCDNCFHSSMKRRYWYSLDGFSTLTFKEKLDRIKEAFYAEKKSSIRNYFINCGIIGDTKPSLVMEHLLNEGLFPAKKFESLHISQLNTFVRWFTNKECEDFTDFLGCQYFQHPK
jgi:hypothetical protein